MLIIIANFIWFPSAKKRSFGDCDERYVLNVPVTFSFSRYFTLDKVFFGTTQFLIATCIQGSHLLIFMLRLLHENKYILESGYITSML